MPMALLAPRPVPVRFEAMEFIDPQPVALCDQGGRPLGPRAQNTRVRILDATVELLGQKPMRELRVIDIARRIGSSPATFYQYFKDVEDVVLHLASHVSEFTPELVELIQGDWTGRAGHERGRRLAEVVIGHWDRYAPILRVRNNACDEGDLAFRELRLSTMMPLVRAFAEIIERSQRVAAAHSAAQVRARGEGAQEEPWEGGRLHPMMGAVALASVLERLSMYHVSIEGLGGSREHLIETLATLLQSMLTVKR
ncbi:TetR/AcrR family transcriptional regulator [Myxococcota bacterium]|nr:TetR/AcrR family transcriptional regulator [Myxococcota bacterium]